MGAQRLPAKLFRTILLSVAVLSAPLFAQGPNGPGAGTGSWWERPWWNSRLVQDLNLTETQRSDIRATVREYRDKIIDNRTTMQKADADVQDAFGENPVDQHKANDAIERLSAARGDLTRTLSLMSLKLRTILTAEQWQELQRRQPGPRGGREPFSGRRGRFGGAPPTGFAK